MSTQITLTEQELDWAKMLAAARWRWFASSIGTDEEMIHLSALIECMEFAVCKAFNLYPDLDPRYPRMRLISRQGKHLLVLAARNAGNPYYMADARKGIDLYVCCDGGYTTDPPLTFTIYGIATPEDIDSSNRIVNERIKSTDSAIVKELCERH